MAVKKKSKMGRPSKYKEEYCEMLYNHMASGLSFDSFAAEADVCLDTIYEWTKKHKNFSEAKNRGSAASLRFWEKMGRAGATGKIKGFNVSAWIFNMKNRFSWRDRADVQYSGDLAGNVIVKVDREDMGL